MRALLRKETGENFSSILHKHRVEAAKHLLRESIYSLEEIAGAVGYQSLSFFFKIFKKIYRHDPEIIFGQPWRPGGKINASGISSGGITLEVLKDLIQ